MAAGPERLTEAMRALEAAFLIGVDGVTEIWLVRHGDCYENMDAGEDPPLSPLGRRQAALLAKRVQRVSPAAIYSSPYRRARETAEMLGGKVEVDPRLVEMRMELNESGQFDFQEPPAEVIERMGAVTSEIAEAHPGKKVVAVTHAGAMIVFLTHVLQLEPGQLRFLPYYTSVNIIRTLGERRMIATLGDAAHLE